MKNLSSIIGAASFTFLVASSAQAACLTSDIAGTWIAQGTAGSSPGRCRIVIAANGQIQSASLCSYVQNQSSGIKISLRITGTFTLDGAANCSFSGAIATAGNRVFQAKIQAALSRDKLVLVASGIGSDPAGTEEEVIFSAVKL